MRHILCLLLCTACSSKDDGTDEGIAALGGGTHKIGNITLTVIGTDDDGLDVPRDLAFSPAVDDELWVVNQRDDSVTVFNGTGTAGQTSEHIVDPYAIHFMEEVSSIAFGAAMYDGSSLPNFATCQESLNTYNDQAEGNEFMGPTLWTSDRDLFGESNQDAVDFLTNLWGMYSDLGSHLDMLHESPLCTGIAWEDDNVYWVMNGRDGSIDRADFKDDHGAGFDDHDDGTIDVYARGEFSRTPDVPSHLEFDPNSGFLYIADTGNNAIKVLDTTSGTQGARHYGVESNRYYEMEDAQVWTLVDGDAVNMSQPSGLALVEDTLLITDHGSGIIYAFDLDGELIDWLDTGRGDGAIMGIIGRTLDDLWVVDANADEVLRLQP